jgi:hypothetical protein
MGVPGSFLVPAAHAARPDHEAPPVDRRRRRVASSVLPLATALTLLSLAVVARAEDTVVLEVGTVLATNASSQIDAELASIRGQLERLFQYSSYRLVKQEQSDVSCGKPATFEIPGGRQLLVMAKDARGGRVALNVALLNDRHVLMRTDLSLGKRGTIMVGGPRYEDGVLIIWIGARRNNPSETPVPGAAR